MSGQLSPDGYYYWDGTAWRPVHRAAPAQPRRLRVSVLIALAVVVALVLSSLAVLGLIRIAIGMQQSLQRQLTPSCSANGTPGHDLAEGDTLCGYRLGTSELSATCAGSELPAGLRAWEKVGAHGEPTSTDVQVDDSGCDLVVAPGHVVWLEGSSREPADVVAVADYSPGTDWGIVGMEIACTKSNCLKLSVDPAGVYRIDEFPASGSSHNVARGALPFATMSQLNRANRLVFRYRAGDVEVFLDGYFVVRATTTASYGDGFIDFSMNDLIGSEPADVHLADLRVFAST